MALLATGMRLGILYLSTVRVAYTNLPGVGGRSLAGVGVFVPGRHGYHYPGGDDLPDHFGHGKGEVTAKRHADDSRSDTISFHPVKTWG